MKAQPGARIEPHDLQQRTGDPHVTEQTRGASPRQLARIAGALYLINIVLGAFATAIVPAIVVVSGDAAATAHNIQTVFFGFDILIFAYLVLRSTFLPRAISVLLAIDGLAYLVYSFANLLAPGFAAQLVPWIQLPALIGEGSLCLWLLLVGVDVERWKEQASAAIRMWSTPMGALE